MDVQRQLLKEIADSFHEAPADAQKKFLEEALGPRVLQIVERNYDTKTQTWKGYAKNYNDIFEGITVRTANFPTDVFYKGMRVNNYAYLKMCLQLNRGAKLCGSIEVGVDDYDQIYVGLVQNGAVMIDQFRDTLLFPGSLSLRSFFGKVLEDDTMAIGKPAYELWLNRNRNIRRLAIRWLPTSFDKWNDVRKVFRALSTFPRLSHLYLGVRHGKADDVVREVFEKEFRKQKELINSMRREYSMPRIFWLNDVQFRHGIRKGQFTETDEQFEDVKLPGEMDLGNFREGRPGDFRDGIDI